MKRLNNTPKKRLDNQRGISSIEILPMLVMFVMLSGFCLGFFSVTHTAIMHSISARAIAFDTFANRADLYYFHPQRGFETEYLSLGYRTHGIIDPDAGNSLDFVATDVKISYGWEANLENEDDANVHMNEIMQIDNDRWTSAGVNPVWIRVYYGMCLSPECGGRL
jgi:hypothetical protein